MGGNMNKKVLFVLFAILMMAVMTVSVSADRDGYNNWCNMDQYGCWVTGEDGAQNYIMFWSESARTYFMGPNSNAVVTDYPADSNGKLGMSNGAPKKTKSVRPLTDEEIQMIKDYNQLWNENHDEQVSYTAMYNYFKDHPDNISSVYNSYKNSLE